MPLTHAETELWQFKLKVGERHINGKLYKFCQSIKTNTQRFTNFILFEFY